jgi:hypothetical protein
MKRIPGVHYKYIEEKKDNPIAEYVKNANKRVFESGSQRDDDTNKPLVNHLDAYVRLRFGYLLRMGANKYEKNNWQKGQPDESSLESLHRHLAKYELGDRSEDHLACIMFGLQLIMKNEQKEGIAIDHYYKEHENNS